MSDAQPLKKEISDQVKQLNWYLQSPKMSPLQLEEVKIALNNTLQRLKDTLG